MTLTWLNTTPEGFNTNPASKYITAKKQSTTGGVLGAAARNTTSQYMAHVCMHAAARTMYNHMIHAEFNGKAHMYVVTRETNLTTNDAGSKRWIPQV